MRFRLALAVFLSIVLIGVASWSRFDSKKGGPPGELVAVSSGNNSNYENVLINPILGNATSSTGENLTNTDIISRQMLIDYMDLSATGGATDAGLNALANKYVESIPLIQESFNVSLKSSDIDIVPNTTENFQKYERVVSQIHRKYGDQMKTTYPGNEVLSSASPESYSYLKSLASFYLEMAEEMSKVPTPVNLASAHLRLVNNYFSTAKAMSALVEAEKDPATAAAGIMVVRNNTQEQNSIITEINQIIMKNTI
ncbi:MAG: hypothetical protein ABIF06_00010 [bacterium]